MLDRQWHRHYRRAGQQVFWLAGLLAMLSLLPAILPFGGRLALRGDFIEQQIPFIYETKRMLASGTPFWSWNSFMGSNFIGHYAFYTLGSPFVWALLPLSEGLIPYGITVMVILKIMVAAWTAFLYLRRWVKQPYYAQIGALLYAFSGFTIINTQFYHFADIIAVFPLLPLALEQALAGERRGGLALACAVNVMVNYYFFAGTALFMGLYGLFRLFAQDMGGKRKLLRLLGILAECGLGCLMAGFLLLPAAWAMLGISRTGRFMVFDFSEQYRLADILERIRVLLMPIEDLVLHPFFGGAASWSSVSAYLPVFGLVPVLYLALTRRWRWSLGLILALVTISLIMPLNRLFVLGSNFFYTRWWYGLVLVLCLPTVQALEALENREKRDNRGLVLAYGLSMAVIVVLIGPFLLPKAWLDSLAQGEGLLGTLARGVRAQTEQLYAGSRQDQIRALVVTALNYGCLLWFLRPGKLQKRGISMAVISVCVVVNYASFLYVTNGAVLPGDPLGHPADISYYAQHELLDQRPGSQGTTYTGRVDYPRKIKNYGLLVNAPAISLFHSLRNSYLDGFVERAGFGYDELPFVMPPDSRDGALRALLGVTHYLNYDEVNYPGAPEGFTYQGTEGDVTVYRNDHALPLGFAYTAYSVRLLDELWKENTADVMLNAAVLDQKTLALVSDWMQPLVREAELPWQEAVQARRQAALEDVEMTPSGLTANITLSQKSLVFISAQYDKGWQATVGGRPVEILPVNLGFMGLVVEPGTDIPIVLSYYPRGLNEGIAVSLVAIGIWCGWMVLQRRRNVKEAHLG